MSYRKRCIINDIDDNENNDTLLRICDRLRDSVCEKLPSKKMEVSVMFVHTKRDIVVAGCMSGGNLFDIGGKVFPRLTKH